MRRDPQTILREAIRTADDIVAMLGDMTESQFVEDLRTQRAIERSFEIVGEVLARLARDSPEVAARRPEHRRVIDFRSVLAHGYGVADPRFAFGLARTRPPALPGALHSAC